MLANKGRTPPHAGRCLTKTDREPRRAHPPFGRVLVFDKRAVVQDLRVSGHIRVAIDRPAPDIDRLKCREPCARGFQMEARLRDPEDFVASIPDPGLFVDLRQFRRINHLRQ